MERGPHRSELPEKSELEGKYLNCREELTLFYVDCPENITWELSINGVKFEGSKSMTTGNKYRLEVHMDLYPNCVLQEKREELEREGKRQAYERKLLWNKKK